MTKYICVRKVDFGPKEYEVGDIEEVDKLEKTKVENYEFGDIAFSTKSHYIVRDTGFKWNKNSFKHFFRKAQPKDTVPKHILKPLLIIFLYELSKAITYEIIVRKQANDMVEQPGYDEIDLWKKL
ncbi:MULTISPECIES: transcriptional activator RinB [Staphylococcus]|uniref:Uncharacterized protein n=1 Tax=Staphylococcus equorum TaxID=246432 RepID=A0AAW7AM71_9STAP|nr:hypothetical protein [Staphylococcus equorum]MDK9867049.1 hypothetical protein [Staphylococcus equorum]MDK9869989.1 hypothetical protein [Staphylococcus equorum]